MAISSYMLVLKTIKIVHLCVVLRNGKLPYDNMDNLLSLSREGGITSSRKGIVDNLSMTYDGNMLASVSDSAPAPSVTGSADFRGGMSGNAGAHPVEGGVSVGQFVESGGVDAKVVATDAAVGAVTGGVMQKASSKLWNAREKTINNLSPSKYVETVEKEVKKERILSGRGTSGTAARAEIHKETVARTNNLYQTDVFVADFSYNAANNAVNNTVQMGTTSLMQKLTGSKE